MTDKLPLGMRLLKWIGLRRKDGFTVQEASKYMDTTESDVADELKRLLRLGLVAETGVAGEYRYVEPNRLQAPRNSRTQVPLTHYLQPIVAVGSKEVRGYEALLRHTGTPARSPEYLLQAAVDAGTLDTFEVGCRYLALEQLHQLRPHQFLCVNVDPRVADIRPFDGVPLALRRRVHLEITEYGTLLENAAFLGVVAAWRRLGYKILLDDFGAGSSGLSVLNQVRPDGIKLDRGLVTGAAEDPYRVTMLRHLTQFCRELGIEIVAEGVETVDDWQMLATLGIPFAQGFLLGRPAPAAGDCEQMFAEL